MRSMSRSFLLAAALVAATGDAHAQVIIRIAADPAVNANTKPAVNTAGQVAFRGLAGTTTAAIYRGDGGPLTTIASSADTFTGGFGVATDQGQPAINASGAVAFYGITASNRGIFVGTGAGGYTTIATNTGALSGSSFGPIPSINASGQVAFSAGPGGGNGGVYVGNGGSLTTIAANTGGFLTLPASPALNDGGTAAFYGAGLSGAFSKGIYTLPGGE